MLLRRLSWVGEEASGRTFLTFERIFFGLLFQGVLTFLRIPFFLRRLFFLSSFALVLNFLVYRHSLYALEDHRFFVGFVTWS